MQCSTDIILDTPSQTNANTTEVSETAMLTINMGKKMSTRFDGLDNELLNLNNVIIKIFQVQNKPVNES